MGRATFHDFKEAFDFTVEALGLLGTAFAVWYKAEALRSIYRGIRGRATSVDNTVTLEALGTGLGQQIAADIAHRLDRMGHHGEADRLNALRREANSRSPSPSPGPGTPGHVV